jgi:hypothetical protein
MFSQPLGVVRSDDWVFFWSMMMSGLHYNITPCESKSVQILSDVSKTMTAMTAFFFHGSESESHVCLHFFRRAYLYR